MTPLVIYHGHCRDGFCSAWVASQFLEDAEFFPADYGSDAPLNFLGDPSIRLIRDRDVYIVDFSYPRSDMTAIAAYAKSLTVLDHHRTAEADLEGFEAESRELGRDVTVVFDMERSGAGITWDWLSQREKLVQYVTRPWLVNYVEDRDLWRFNYLDSEAVNAYIATLPFEFGEWNKASVLGLDEVTERGKICQTKTAQYIRETLAANAQLVDFAGEDVPLVNASPVDLSELVRELFDQTDDAPFAMGFSQAGDGRYHYSLRSNEDFDVSEVARRYGGGGHAQAAGFVSEEIVHRHLRRATLESR